MGNILTIKNNPASGNAVLGETHNSRQERAFTRSVGTEQDMGLSGFYLQIDIMENFFILY